MIINMTSGGVVPERILDAQTITPSTEDQVIEEGTYLREPIIILGDEDFIPENIPADTNLFGLQGTRPPDHGLNVWERGNYGGNRPYSIRFQFISQIGTGDANKIQVIPTGIGIEEVTLSMLANFYLFGNQSSGDKAYFNSNGTQITRYHDNVYVSNGTCSYNPSTGILTTQHVVLQDASVATNTLTGELPPEYITQDFIVSDNPAAYPSNGQKGEYYYKLLASVSSANVMSLTNDALDTVQQDYRNRVETEVSNA